MNTLSRNELRILAAQQRGPCVSIFLPTHRTGAETQQDPLQLKNAIRAAEKRMIAEEHRFGFHRSTQVEEMLEPISALLETEQFWLHPGDGLAIFRSPQVFRSYWLPFSVKERIMLSEHLYLKPLFPLLTSEGRYYVLALSQNELRLLEGTHYGIHEVELPDTVPESLAEVIGSEYQENDVRHYSSSSGASIGKGGRRAAIFYGQGVGIDDTKDNILRYFRQINKGLHELLYDETAPMVLAGVEFLLPMYREANTYPHIIEEVIPGNPDKLKAETLHEKAWSIVEPYFLKAQRDAIATYQAQAGTGLASNNVSEIVPAAYYGRVESLFVSKDDELWGTFDPRTSAVAVHTVAEPSDDDLLDVAATQTFFRNGAVYVVERAEVPGEELSAAVYRY